MSSRGIHRFYAGWLAAATMLASGLSAQGTSQPILPLDSLLNIPISAASRYEQVSGEAPASISVITRDDLERFGFRSVSDAIESLRGFHATFDRVTHGLGSGGFARPSDANSRLLVLLDGTRWNGVMDGEAGIDESLGLTLDMVERVEVVRGPGSALYGSSAMLAVVNIVTRGGAVPEAVRSRVTSGTFGLRGVQADGDAHVGDGVVLTADASWSDSDGPDAFFPEFAGTPSGGHLVGRDAERLYGWGVSATDGTWTAFVRGSGRRKDDPTARYGSTFDTDGSTIRRDHVSAVVQFRRSLSPSVGVEAEAFAHRSASEIALQFDEPLPDRIIETRAREWGTEVQLRVDPSPSQRVVVGGGYRFADPSARILANGVANLDGVWTRSVASVFGQSDWQLRRDLSLVVGLRADRYSTSRSAASPRAAMVYHPTGSSTLKLLYGSAFRAPTLVEQFAEEPGLIKANPDLGPERMQQVEIVWEHRVAEGFQLVLSAYEYRIEDLIDFGYDLDDNLLQYQNLDRVRSRGLSAEMVGRLPSGVSLFGSGSWQRAVDRTTGLRLANAPTYLFRLGGAADLPGGFRGGFVALVDGERATLYGATTEGYGVVNANLRSPPVRGFVLALSARNVMDTFYRHPAGPEQRMVGVPQDGRAFRLTLSTVF